MTECKKCETEKLDVFILLDRSGSMSSKWDETVSSVNAYVRELQAQGEVTIACFDGHLGPQFDILRKAVKFHDYIPLNSKELQPRGGTPLFDSLEKIVSLAEKANNKKTVIVIMTDGEENESTEITKETAAYIIKRCKSKDWPVIFLGADFDAFGQAKSVGVGLQNTLTMAQGNYGNAMRGLAASTMQYSSAGATMDCMDFNEKDRAVASGKIK